MITDSAEQERQRAYVVWSALERASDHLSPGHPAELYIRRALIAAEEYWKSLPNASEPGVMVERKSAHD